MGSSPPIYVTRSFMPPFEEYQARLADIFRNSCLTNQGPLHHELETVLSSFLEVEHLQLVANGTLALQLALRALNLEDGEVITTPFSYVGTVSSILWEHLSPVFVDIEPHNFTLDPSLIARAVTPRTRAIMPVHVFGYACDIEAIEAVARQFGLKVIYDAAHAFGARFRGRALVANGDVSACSFHATKIFHTGEGGACIVREAEVNRRLELCKRFGHNADDHIQLGINAKMTELHAAMGLSVFPHLSEIIAARKHICELYDQLLTDRPVTRPAPQPELERNYAYYPVLFRSEAELLKAFQAWAEEDIFPRRYFYPALNTLPYLKTRVSCPVAEDVASRVACLPLFPGLSAEQVQRICRPLEKL